MYILFNENPIINLTYGIVYFNNTRIFELPTGTYDVEYILALLHQCKFISRTIPIDVNYVGLKKINTDRYELI